MDLYERKLELKELAFIDESYPYEVDETGIYLDPQGRFILLTASGCSCWDGQYDENSFDTFEALEKFLTNEESSRYNPSLSGGKLLLEEARKNFESVK